MKSLTWKSERGSSLVEILVVMVVLVVGIFTIIRIFPTGFDILQYTGNASVAHRMAEAEVEFWRTNAENLPDGIVAIQPGATLYDTVIDPTVRPNDFISGTQAAGADPRVRESIASKLPKGTNLTEDEVERWVGANRSRRILGEVVRIPAPATRKAVDRDLVSSVYSLAYAPIEWPATSPTPDIADQYVQIRGNSLSSVDVTGLQKDALNPTVANLRPRQYAIDYTQGIVYFPRSDRPRQFIASYTYNTPQGPKTVRADRLLVAATPLNSQLPGSSAKLRVTVQGSEVFDGNFKGVEPGTEAVAPKFRFLLGVQPFSTDPYEYKVLSSYALGVQFAASIAFNPSGFKQYDTLPGGARIPLQAKIDYIVKDWRILHQDITLPSQPPYRTRLALPYVKQAGVTTGETTLEPWAGLTGDGRIPVSIIGVDLADGDLILDNTKQYPGGFNIDFSTGTLFFPEGDKALTAYSASGGTNLQNPAGRSYRIFYTVEGDWAVIPQKAFSSYALLDFNRAFGGVEKTLPIANATVYPEIVTDPVTKKRSVQVIFPTTDEGKAVSYDYTYRTKTNRLKTVYGEEQQLTSEARQSGLSIWYFKTSNSTINEVPKPFLMIDLPSDAVVTDATLGTDFVLSNIRGTSFRAVTVWRDRSRWRQEAITTHLTRAAL